MLQVIFLIFIPPLFIGFLWNSTWVSQAANHALEQTQLDAVALSICYQNREFLEASVRAPNQRILLTQNLLNIAGTSCLAEFVATSIAATPLVAEADLVICVSSRLRPLEASGQTHERLQLMRGIEFAEYRKRERLYLLRENHLSLKFIGYSGFSSVEKALVREPLRPESRLIQSQLAALGHQVTWPRIWVSNPLTFSQSFSPQLTYQYRGHRGLRKSASGCQILAQDPLGRDQIKWQARTP